MIEKKKPFKEDKPTTPLSGTLSSSTKDVGSLGIASLRQNLKK